MTRRRSADARRRASASASSNGDLHAVARELGGMLFVVLPRLVFGDLRARTEPLRDIGADTNRFARQLVQPGLVQPRGFDQRIETGAHARFHRRDFLGNGLSEGLRRREPRNLVEHELTVDRAFAAQPPANPLLASFR